MICGETEIGQLASASDLSFKYTQWIVEIEGPCVVHNCSNRLLDLFCVNNHEVSVYGVSHALG